MEASKRVKLSLKEALAGIREKIKNKPLKLVKLSSLKNIKASKHA